MHKCLKPMHKPLEGVGLGQRVSAWSALLGGLPWQSPCGCMHTSRGWLTSLCPKGAAMLISDLPKVHW